MGFLSNTNPLANRTYPPTIRHRRVKVMILEQKKLDFKSYEPESYNRFRNSLLNSLGLWQITFPNFFTRCISLESAIFGGVIFARCNFLWVPYLSISGGIFLLCYFCCVMRYFCKVPLFSNDIMGCLFCWVPSLLDVITWVYHLLACLT